jgi:hypothetical protein
MLTLAAPLLLLAAPQLVGGEFKRLRTVENQPNNGASLGYNLADAGDVNADGVDDFAMSLPNFGRVGYSATRGKVLVFSGADGAFLREFEGRDDDLLFGMALDSAGDFDADGFDDLIVGGRRDPPYSSLGIVRVLSVRHNRVLFATQSTLSDDGFGTSVAGVGDIDGDGHAEIAYGLPGFNNDAGRIEVVSGATGFQLFSLDAAQARERIGKTVVGVGDVDLDGIPDIATSDSIFGPQHSDSLGRATVYSSGTRMQIWGRNGERSGDLFGLDIAAAGDVNGDGRADLVVGAPGWGRTRDESLGAAYVLTGLDGSTLVQVQGPHHLSHFGSAVSGNCDVNGDRMPDVLVGAGLASMPNGAPLGGAVFLFSGADGMRLNTFLGNERFASLGMDVAFLGREEPKGHARFAFGMPGHAVQGGGFGAAEMVVFRPYLSTDSETISATGGQVTATIDFPERDAGDPYMLMISRTGIGPSDFNGLTVPLTQDSMFARAVAGDYPVLATGTAGLLDAAGDATAIYLAWQPQLSANVGNTFWIAALLQDPLTGAPQRVSVAVPMSVVP